MHPIITSAANPKIKQLLGYQKARDRRTDGVFVIEGLKELNLAIGAGYELRTVFFCPDIIPAEEASHLVSRPDLLIPVQRAVFDKVAYRESTGGVIAVAVQRRHLLADLQVSATPLLIIIESVEKPGNLGAILRTADAAGVDGLIICDPHTDFYNPNVIRASVGCLFTVPVASCSTDDAQAWLRKHNIRIYCTYLEAAKPYHEVDYTGPCAIVMGTEATGLTQAWTKNSDANVLIPMQGKIDSMNVSTATAVVVFEARRQRGLRTNH